MAKSLITLVLLCANLSARVTAPHATADDEGNPGASSTHSVNPVIEWNRTLLAIVRTAGAQPPQFIRLAASPSCMLPSMTRSTTLTESSALTLSPSQTSRGVLPDPPPQSRPPVMYWLRS